FVVELESPCAFFDKLAAFATLSPVQKATVEANGDAWAIAPETYIGNGPFMITEWVPGSHIVFGKNPNYWNKDAIKLDSIKALLMEDPNAAYSAYQTGEALMIKDVPTEEIPSLEGKPDFHVDPLLGTYYISLNDAKEPFTNPLVRKALSLAIDREYVAKTLMQGTYTAAYNFIGTGVTDFDGTEFMKNANGGKSYLP
ncbi:MAG: ABC transporter substrate-binding protein, partial [Ruthenibacterium sp.]